jgi:hypothetical protein
MGARVSSKGFEQTTRSRISLLFAGLVLLCVTRPPRAALDNGWPIMGPSAAEIPEALGDGREAAPGDSAAETGLRVLTRALLATAAGGSNGQGFKDAHPVDDKPAAPGQASKSSDVTHAEAQAFAKAVLSEPGVDAAEQAEARAAKALVPTTASAPATEGPQVSPRENPSRSAGPAGVTQRQAQILDEYAAMCREVERAHVRWPGPPLPPPVVPHAIWPYGPGYFYPPPW